MRFVGGTYFFDVNETLLTDSQRAEVRAIAAAGDPHRAQRLAESYELQAIREAGHEDDDPRFSEFLSEVPEFLSEVPERGEGKEPHQVRLAGRAAMKVTPLAQPVETQVHQSDAGLLFQQRPTRPPAVALALLLSALLAAGALMLAAAQKLGLL
jgi:hypothetical protein